LVEEVADFGRLRQTGNNAPQLNLVTEIPGLNYNVGNLYGCRNWVEYGLNQSKNELGWTDFLTKYQDIEKWWEVLTYSLACLPTR